MTGEDDAGDDGTLLKGKTPMDEAPLVEDDERADDDDADDDDDDGTFDDRTEFAVDSDDDKWLDGELLLLNVENVSSTDDSSLRNDDTLPLAWSFDVRSLSEHGTINMLITMMHEKCEIHFT